MAGWLRRPHREEGGFTLVEMIVTIAVGGLVVGAIFPIFLLLSRVESAWSSNSQARTIGLIAEQALARDLRTYLVVQEANCSVGACQPLVLRGVGNAAKLGSTFCVTYSIKPDDTDSNLPRLVRDTRDSDSTVATSRSTVAHGIWSLKSSPGPKSSVSLSLELTAVGHAGVTVHIPAEPVLMITPRIATGESDQRDPCL